MSGHTICINMHELPVGETTTGSDFRDSESSDRLRDITRTVPKLVPAHNEGLKKLSKQATTEIYPH